MRQHTRQVGPQKRTREGDFQRSTATVFVSRLILHTAAVIATPLQHKSQTVPHSQSETSTMGALRNLLPVIVLLVVVGIAAFVGYQVRHLPLTRFLGDLLAKPFISRTRSLTVLLPRADLPMDK